MQCAAVGSISEFPFCWAHDLMQEIFRPGLVCSAPPVYAQRAGLSDVSNDRTQLWQNFPKIRRQRKSWQLQVHHKIPIEIKNQFFFFNLCFFETFNITYLMCQFGSFHCWFLLGKISAVPGDAGAIVALAGPAGAV